MDSLPLAEDPALVASPFKPPTSKISRPESSRTLGKLPITNVVLKTANPN